MVGYRLEVKKKGFMPVRKKKGGLLRAEADAATSVVGNVCGGTSCEECSTYQRSCQSAATTHIGSVYRGTAQPSL